MALFTTGTVIVEAGSREVQGFDTTWLLSEVRGGILFFGNADGVIETVEADDRLTLALPWPGRSGRGRYAIALSTAQAASAVVAFERLNDILNSFRGLSTLGRQVASAATAEQMRRLLGVGTGNLKIDAAGTLAQRGAHDAKPAGFTYLATDQSSVYVRVGEAGWTGPYALASGEDGREVEISQAGGYIVWRYAGETSWRNVVALDTLRGNDGADGLNVELRRDDAFIQWRPEGGEWANLVALDDIRGSAAESTIAAIEAADRADAAAVRSDADADRSEQALTTVTAIAGVVATDAGRAEAGATRSEQEADRSEASATVSTGQAAAAAESRGEAEGFASDAAEARSGSEAARALARRYANDPADADIEEPGTRSSRFFADVSRGHSEAAADENVAAGLSADSARADAATASEQRQAVDAVKADVDQSKIFVVGQADRAETEADRSEAAATRAENADASTHPQRRDNPHEVTLAQASNNTMSVANGKAMVGTEEVAGKGFVTGSVDAAIALLRNSVPAAYNTLKTLYDLLIDHTSRTNNPHGVTKAQVGLGSVENQSPVGMVSLGTQQSSSIELGRSGTGDRNAFIDFHAHGTPGANDHSARAIRNSGVNGAFSLENTGTGTLALKARTVTMVLPTNNVVIDDAAGYARIAPVHPELWLDRPTRVNSASLADQENPALRGTQGNTQIWWISGSGKAKFAEVSVGDNLVFHEGRPPTAGQVGAVPADTFAAFAARRDNPHEVTKGQVGLGSVSNTSDAEKRAADDLVYPRLDGANAGPLSLRNKLINGGFDYWQRSAGQTIVGCFSDDRWFNSFEGGSVTFDRFTINNSALSVSLSQGKYAARVVRNADAGTAGYAFKWQKLEGLRQYAGRRVAISFNVAASVAGRSVAVDLIQDFGTGGSPSALVEGIGAAKFAVGTTGARVTMFVDVPTHIGKTFGTNGDDGLILRIWFDAGSNHNAKTASLGRQSGTFYLGDVQLELGGIATPFERRDLGLELMLCQRYFCKTFPIEVAPTINHAGGRLSIAWAYSAADAYANTPGGFPVVMRAVPSIIFFPSASGPGSLGSVSVFSGSAPWNARAVNGVNVSDSAIGHITFNPALSNGNQTIWALYHYTANAEFY